MSHKKNMKASGRIEKKLRKYGANISSEVRKILTSSPTVLLDGDSAENLSVPKDESNIPTPAAVESPAQEQNYSSQDEYDVCHPTGDEMRDKVRALLSNALRINASAEDTPNCITVAAAIEEAMSKKFQYNNRSYKLKYREISFNLKDPKNQKLRDAVLKKELAPSRVVDMTTEELANDELKEIRQKTNERIMRCVTVEYVEEDPDEKPEERLEEYGF